MDLWQLKRNVKEIKINDLLDESVMATKETIINHVKTQMLFGKASDDSTLGEYAWESYADDKANFVASYHAPYGVYNFALHGDFHNAMYLRPLLNAYEIGSTDKKTNYLERLAGKYVKAGIKIGGQRTFGISKKNLTDYCDNQLAPLLRKTILTKLSK